jgi:DNA-binding LacI/PurR family transcriptional regulator
MKRFMNSSSSKISIRKVAASARVSTGTVSRVLSGHGEVGEVYAQRVRKAVEKLGYRPNPAASSLRRRGPAGHSGIPWRTQTIGLLIGGMSGEIFLGDEFQQRFLEGIQSALAEKGLHLLFAACGDEAKAGRLPLMVAEGRVDGVILKTGSDDPGWARALAAAVPTVLLMGRLPSVAAPSVMCDNASGMGRLVEQLQSLGHRNLAFLSVRDRHQAPNRHHQERLSAFRRAAEELDFEPGALSVEIPDRDWETQSLDEVIAGSLDRLLAKGRTRPTAICCANDLYALSLIQAAAKRGLALPRDLSITGFMNTLAGANAAVPLTTISIPGRELGAASVSALEERIANPSGVPRHLLIEGELVPRASTGNAPR